MTELIVCLMHGLLLRAIDGLPDPEYHFLGADRVERWLRHG